LISQSRGLGDVYKRKRLADDVRDATYHWIFE
jgi:hypothetical protein